MGAIRAPRHGSMQVWPRKRAKRIYPKVRTWAASKDAKALGFVGYKVGMTQIMATDTRKASRTKGETIGIPVTILECPPLKVYGFRMYKKDAYGSHAFLDFYTKQDKDLLRKLKASKKSHDDKLAKATTEGISEITLVVFTQPRKTGFGKKTPEVFELGIGGTIEQKLEFAKANLGKEISADQVFSEGQLVDVHAVTKGHGLQGPTKRFGLMLRSHKSEKTKRGPGSLGPWHPHKISFRVAHLGQMGFHTRTDYNKQIIKIGTNPEEVNKKSGFKRYGTVRTTYMLVKGSIAGAQKRLIRLSMPVRPKKLQVSLPTLESINK